MRIAKRAPNKVFFHLSNTIERRGVVTTYSYNTEFGGLAHGEADHCLNVPW